MTSRLFTDDTTYIKNIPARRVGSSKGHWGRSYWKMLHTMSLHYPMRPSIQEQKDMVDFILKLKVAIPCRECKEHYEAFLQKRNLWEATVSRSSLFCFFVDLHNQVNVRNNKPRVSYEEAFQYYGMP